MAGVRDYIDVGYRRNENADLAAGCDRVLVLVLSPFGGRSLHRPEWGLGLSAQVEELRSGGSRVETIGPDADVLEAFGANMMTRQRVRGPPGPGTHRSSAQLRPSPGSGAEAGPTGTRSLGCEDSQPPGPRAPICRQRLWEPSRS